MQIFEISVKFQSNEAESDAKNLKNPLNFDQLKSKVMQKFEISVKF